MRCSVQNCTNSTKNATKSEGITFHLFPKDPVIRSAWLEALALTNFEPKERSLVCSEHFRNEDFFDTKMGLRKIKKEAVPVAVLDPDEDQEEPATLRVCRVCLTMGTKMYDIKYRSLDQQYEHVTGLFFNIEDRLPQKLCWECAHRLHNAVSFRNKAIRAHGILASILHTAAYISIKDIKSINRIENKLRSTLVKKKFEDEHIFNYKENVEIKDEKHNGFNHIDEEDNKNDKANSNMDMNNDHINAVDNDDDFNNDDVQNDSDMFNGFDSEAKDLQIMQVEVKDETNSDMFYTEFVDNGVVENFESDDDKKLSEIYPELVEKRKVKVKIKDKKKKVKDKEKKQRAVKRKVECDGENKSKEDELSFVDKYKTNEIKRRKNEGPNENLFIISSLTYAEQIAEVEKRQESTMYKSAPFKCNICYRGFSAKERYDAHVVRHSDQSGIYECFICKTRLKTGRALRKHLTAQHTEQFSCKGCPFVTRNRGVAREHERWHSGAKYQCPHCPSTFEKVTTYMGHIRIKHVSDFVCELCGYTFVSQKGIDVHKKKKHRLHDRQVELLGPYCEVCDVKFVSEEAHTRHLKLSGRHSSDNDPNRIRNDSQSVRSENTGRSPRQIERRPSIHPRKPEQSRVPGPVPCEQCGVQLRDLRLYAQHFRKAHPDKNRTKYPAMKTPCMCEQCGRIFQSMALLKDHMWVHTGEKRFKCSHCPKSFTQKTNLVFHERVHSSTRPTYECGLCGKHFAFYNNRRRHMFIHTGLKPYKCETCGKSFTTAGEQRAHIEHVHLKKPWPRRARRHNVDGTLQED